jgi:hypothetical protein
MHETILLHSRRRRMGVRFQLIQDVVGVIVLVPAALARIGAGSVSYKVLGALEIAVIAIAVLAAIRDLRSSDDGKEDGVDYTNLMVGAALLVEWVVSVSSGRKWFSPTLVVALTSLFLAWFRPWLQHRAGPPRIELDDEGIVTRFSALRRFAIQWVQISRIVADKNTILFHLTNGTQRRLCLRRYDNRQDIVQAIERTAAARGL